MVSTPYLTFSQNNSRYGIEAHLVQEILPLPELVVIEEAPKDIVGVLNLRSHVLPVMHLDLRFGRSLQTCKLSDNVIVLDWEGLQVGMIVNQVHEVENIDLEATTGEINYGRDIDSSIRFLSGVAKVGTEILLLLSPEKLIREPDAIETLQSDQAFFSNFLDDEVAHLEQLDSAEDAPTIYSFYDRCCPNATSAERAIFQQRAEHLRLPTEIESTDFTGLMPLAVIGLNGEYFGLDLEAVREFTKICQVTPIPCCPPHIRGNMNLRGEIVTLVDIRRALNLPLDSAQAEPQAIIVDVDDTIVGLPVDEVLDVMYLHPAEIGSIPATAQGSGNGHLRGTATYAERMLTILNLNKLFSAGGLTVDEVT